MRKSPVWNPKASHRPLPILRDEHQKCSEEQITKTLTRPHLNLHSNLRKITSLPCGGACWEPEYWILSRTQTTRSFISICQHVIRSLKAQGI